MPSQIVDANGVDVMRHQVGSTVEKYVRSRVEDDASFRSRRSGWLLCRKGGAIVDSFSSGFDFVCVEDIEGLIENSARGSLPRSHFLMPIGLQSI